MPVGRSYNTTEGDATKRFLNAKTLAIAVQTFRPVLVAIYPVIGSLYPCYLGRVPRLKAAGNICARQPGARSELGDVRSTSQLCIGLPHVTHHQPHGSVVLTHRSNTEQFAIYPSPARGDSRAPGRLL